MFTLRLSFVVCRSRSFNVYSISDAPTLSPFADSHILFPLHALLASFPKMHFILLLTTEPNPKRSDCIWIIIIIIIICFSVSVSCGHISNMVPKDPSCFHFINRYTRLLYLFINFFFCSLSLSLFFIVRKKFNKLYSYPIITVCVWLL